MAKTLELNFGGEFGPVKISVRNPKDSLTPAEIKAAMNKIVLAKVFTSSNGDIISATSARVVDRTIQDIVLP